MKKLALFAIAAAIPAAAAKARLYDLDTGAVVILEYKNRWNIGHGPIKGTLSNGTAIAGEYRTVESAYKTTGEQHGSAVLTGKDVVIDCAYITSNSLTSHGTGTCTDNRGKRYRLIF